MDFRCPTCRKLVARGSIAFPFCSPRCRDIDLGGWFEERFRVPGEPLADDIESDGRESDPGAAGARDEP
jgi:endogenous inhibitor of DNA gyrase (YacG/DUF329 family)